MRGRSVVSIASPERSIGCADQSSPRASFWTAAHGAKKMAGSRPAMMGWTAPDGIVCARMVSVNHTRQKEPSAMKTIMIGLDLAKTVFQVHGIDEAGNVVHRRRLRRSQLEGFFSELAPAVVGMEACGSAHHWARLFESLGHEVRLMAPAYVKPYVKRNKTDGRDAEAICEAMQRPVMRLPVIAPAGASRPCSAISKPGASISKIPTLPIPPSSPPC
jgi:hypothetical protein